MYAMFVKEMQQFLRGIISKVAGGLLLLSWILLILAARFEVPELEELQYCDISMILPYFQIFLYSLGMIAIGVLIVVIILGSSAGRWRAELGDPAFSPGITTCTPAWQLALGKWSAMTAQTVTGFIFGSLLPLKIFLGLKTVKNLGEMLGKFGAVDVTLAQMMTDFAKLGMKFPVAAICIIVALSSTALAVCSLKPRNRGKFDIGAMAVVLLLGVQSFSLIYGVRMEHFELEIIARTVIITVGSLALISSGVSAPGSNRLFFFKAWVFISIFFLQPVVRAMADTSSRMVWAEELMAAAFFFILCSIFERVIQSRRVLAQMRNPLIATVAFPFTTGALNSMVLSIIFVIAAYFIYPNDKELFLHSFISMMAWAALCNLAGLFFEKMGKRFIRFLAFLIGGWILGIIICWIKEEYQGVLEENQALINGFEWLLIIISMLLLAINYNSRKKDL